MLTHATKLPQRPSRVVVLGSSGFIGQRLCQRVASESIAMLAIAGSKDTDLTDPTTGSRLRERLQPTDAVIFLSAITPDKGRDSSSLMRNLAIARTVCEAARGAAAHLIYASSDAVYSFDQTRISEATPAAPVDLYGAMHRTRELILAAEAQVPLAILRLAAVYGAGDTHNSYGPNRFMRQALREGRIAMFGNGEETRDHLYVEDAVALILQVLMHRSTGLLNLASGQSVSFHDVAEQIAANTGRTVELQGSVRQNPVTHRAFDTANIKRAFPDFVPTPLEQGLRATVADMKAAPGG